MQMKPWSHSLWSHEEMVVSSCFIFSFSGLARASIMQSEDRVKRNNTDGQLPHNSETHTHLLTNWKKDKKKRKKSVGYRPRHRSWGMWGISGSRPRGWWGCRTIVSETGSAIKQRRRMKKNDITHYTTPYSICHIYKKKKNCVWTHWNRWDAHLSSLILWGALIC